MSPVGRANLSFLCFPHLFLRGARDGDEKPPCSFTEVCFLTLRTIKCSKFVVKLFYFGINEVLIKLFQRWFLIVLSFSKLDTFLKKSREFVFVLLCNSLLGK
ncbi:Protein of unknown function [Gryllus bimaculatus]|nr:Protein of unknown function [Gryllus bimaculatus]